MAGGKALKVWVAVPIESHNQDAGCGTYSGCHPARVRLPVEHDYGDAMKTVRQLREERGWSQLDVAVQLSVSQSIITRWERGIAVPKPGMQHGLARLFGVSVEDLALGPAEQAPQYRP